VKQEISIVSGGTYQHYKGNYYQVIDIARHSETLEKLVVYRGLYGNHELWVRPASMFCESVLFNGNTVPRFHLKQSNG